MNDTFFRVRHELAGQQVAVAGDADHKGREDLETEHLEGDEVRCGAAVASYKKNYRAV